jgi:predicted nucleotidyltransferase
MEDKLNEFVARLKEAAGKNLESVILYGSAARGNYRPGHSDINLLCTLVTINVDELHRVAPVVSWWTKERKETTPLFFLTEELRRSTDVFAIESLDIKRAHRILYGPDVVADLDIPMNLHRVEVEHELRVLLMRLRQHLLHAGHSELELLHIIKRSFSGAVALLRHTLIALGEDPPGEPIKVFTRIESLTGADAAAFAVLQDHRDGSPAPTDILAAYDHYMHALEKVIHTLDGVVPKKQWQRVSS